MAGSIRNKLWLLIALILFPSSPNLRCQETQKNQKQSETQKDQKDKRKKPKDKKKDVEEIGDRDVGKGVNFYSLEKEIALGKQLAEEVERQAKIIDDPVIAEYVNRVGQNLVRNSDAKVPFTIKVIDTDEPNAMSLPGGFLFVNSGLILLADNEAELAGAMAHEIAHVAARHGTRQATRGEIVNLATIPLIFMGGGWTTYGIYQAAGFAIPLGFLRFSRSFEQEADFLGLQYLYKTGYDPDALIDFFEKLENMEKRKPGTLAKVFSTHPMTEDRVTAAQKEIQEIMPPREEYVLNTSEFMTIKARLAGMYKRVRPEKEKDSDGRPTLRRNTPNGKVEPVEGSTKGNDKGDDDSPPVLKKRE